MDEKAFGSRFAVAVEAACQSAEKALGRKLNRNVTVRMYGLGEDGTDLSPDEFLERTYISPDSFYRVIDLAIVETVDASPILFARISGHEPGPLSSCWNGDEGPFKQIQAEKIVQKCSEAPERRAD